MIVSGDTTMHFGTDPMELIQWSSEVTKNPTTTLKSLDGIWNCN